MMPPESLQFFTVDPRWLACLLDGAWSLGRQPAKYWAFDTAYQPWQQLQEGSLTSKTVWPLSGALLNSQLVSAYWPGIEFSGLMTASKKANLLSEQKRGPTTLLVLYDHVLDKLTIQQPPEGIHFGFDITESGEISKPLRYVHIASSCYPPVSKGQTPASGNDAPESYTLATIPQRIPYVIQFDQLAATIAAKLGIPDTVNFSAAEFAMELVESVSSATFTLPTDAEK